MESQLITFFWPNKIGILLDNFTCFQKVIFGGCMYIYCLQIPSFQQQAEEMEVHVSQLKTHNMN